MHHDTNTFTDKITWKVCKKPEHPWVEMVESSVCVSSVWVEGPVHALGKILYLLSCFFAFWFSVWVERSVHALSKSTLSVIMVFAFEFYFGFSVCLEWPGALGKDIITANIFCRVFGHTTQIFQKHHFSKYFCRVFVTQLKYIKNIISANISAGDWSHSSPCFAFFAWSPFADPAVPPGWWSWWSRWKCDTDGPPHWRNGERQCGRANQAPASSPCPAPASRCDQTYQAFQQNLQGTIYEASEWRQQWLILENKNGRIGCAQDELWKLPYASSKATSSMARGFRGPNIWENPPKSPGLRPQ